MERALLFYHFIPILATFMELLENQTDALIAGLRHQILLKCWRSEGWVESVAGNR